MVLGWEFWWVLELAPWSEPAWETTSADPRGLMLGSMSEMQWEMQSETLSGPMWGRR
jgi:hypothetical protein